MTYNYTYFFEYIPFSCDTGLLILIKKYLGIRTQSFEKKTYNQTTTSFAWNTQNWIDYWIKFEILIFFVSNPSSCVLVTYTIARLVVSISSIFFLNWISPNKPHRYVLSKSFLMYLLNSNHILRVRISFSVCTYTFCNSTTF